MSVSEIREKFKHVLIGYEETDEGFESAMQKTAELLDVSLTRVEIAIRSMLK